MKKSFSQKTSVNCHFCKDCIAQNDHTCLLNCELCEYVVCIHNYNQKIGRIMAKAIYEHDHPDMLCSECILNYRYDAGAWHVQMDIVQRLIDERDLMIKEKDRMIDQRDLLIKNQDQIIQNLKQEIIEL